MPYLHTKYTLMQIQANIIVSTLDKNHKMVFSMVFPSMQMSWQVIQICLHNVLDVMESIRHSPLERGAKLFKTNMQLSICKRIPRTNEGYFVLVLWTYVNLIVVIKTIHEQIYFISCIIINNLFHWKLTLRHAYHLMSINVLRLITLQCIDSYFLLTILS